MISEAIRSRILRLHLVEKWPIGTIARDMGLHHTTVRTALVNAGVREALGPPRPRKVDPFVPFICETLRIHPKLRASRLYHMVKERGYDGRPDHFRAVIASLRPPQPAEAFLRLRTLPGEQAQVDWGHFGVMQVGRARRKLYGFVLVLSWSRKIYLRFGYDIGMAGFVRGHIEAFERMGGVPRVLLYDNLRSAVLERIGDAIRFHPTLLELSAHYRYEPRPVAVARGNEKGRVERAIQYIRHAFFAGRSFADLADLNVQADAWCASEAVERRCPEDKTMTVQTAFKQEQPRLLGLPDDAYPGQERVEVAVGKTPYVRFDLNDYSVPYQLCRTSLTVLATVQRVRVLDGDTVVAEHARTFDQGQQVEDPAHVAALVEHKRAAREHRGQDLVIAAAPAVQELLQRLAARGANLGTAVAALCRLLDHYGAAEVQAAVQLVLAHDAPHTGAVRQALERRRHERGLPPPVAVELPEHIRRKAQPVQPHALSGYDQLTTKENDDAKSSQ